MSEQKEFMSALPEQPVGQPESTRPAPVQSSAVEPELAATKVGSVGDGNWHANAGRKGAFRVHQLIQEGKLYEKEHGLKSGRQRLRQLIELGKLYEQEHSLGPGQPKRRERVSGVERQELLATLLHCLVRLAKAILPCGAGAAGGKA